MSRYETIVLEVLVKQKHYPSLDPLQVYELTTAQSCCLISMIH